jgi:aspartyl-tRNA(Asn)/glutamyl-tRNA(Gln) amidotransferase subunit C
MPTCRRSSDVPVRDDILDAVRLARIRLDPGELERLASEVAGIVAHMDALRDLDLTGVPPFAATDAADATDATDAANSTMRPDEPGPEPLVRTPASLAPAWTDGCYTVPLLEPHRPRDCDE